MNKFGLVIVVIAIMGGIPVAAFYLRASMIEQRAVHTAQGTAPLQTLHDSEPHQAPEMIGEIPVPPPPFSEDIFPCSDCHDPDDEVDREPHELTLDHESIELHHDEANRWCLDCHDTQQRDFLHLADGTLIGFTESYRLCGQCHGTVFRDWKVGIHGKRTGDWNGEKRYLLCVHCHDPHSPSFKPIHPFPAPIPPQAID